MESRDRAAEEVAETSATPDAARWQWRLRLLAGSLLLVGLAFIQSPGLLIADTKFDLAVDPIAFLGRATHLWDGTGAFGQLQNQAYGYLWPMGPFFVLGSVIDLPGWVIQRLWMSLVMVVAFLGGARVARALGVRSDVAVLIAAFAYATSPRMLTTLGPISIEAWPSALAPWVLLPLILGSQRGAPRRAAAISGLAVAMVGGVNAAATFAVIPLGVVWLLTREPGPRRRSLMFWWPVFTLVGTLWWLIPLFVMGAYSPPFLDFIETASVTTFPTTPFDALRGTSDWVAYVDPTWRGGGALVADTYTIANSAVLLVLGLLGLMLRGNPHRQFLVLGTLTGMLMVTLGHTGAVEGWFASSIADALDGDLAPIRNVHKFDPILRLPLILGLAVCIERVRFTTTAEAARGTAGMHLGVTVIAALAVIGAAGPAITGSLAPSRPVFDTPGYWANTVNWLDRQGGAGTALLAPGSGFGDYVWGYPRDEPAQFLGADQWAVRNAIPLAPPGNIRMLDAIEERFAQGAGSDGLVPYLRRAGVKYVVVRNDLRPDSDAPDPVLVREVMQNSPGMELVKTFGPDVGGGPTLTVDNRRTLINYGRQEPRKAVEVYAVPDVEYSYAVSAKDLPVVVGGPEDLLSLEDAGVLDGQPTQLATDLGREQSPEPPGNYVLTDGLQQRERFFGRLHDAEAPVTIPGDVNRSGNPTPDYLLEPGDRWLTKADLDGARALSASSSESDSNSIGGPQVSQSPLSAIDGDPATQWVSAEGNSAAPWWQVTLEEEAAPTEVVLTGGAAMEGRQQVRVRTQSGTTTPVTLRPDSEATIPLDGNPTNTIRIERVGAGANQFALADVQIDGEEPVSRPLVLPAPPSSWSAPHSVVLSRLGDARTGCLEVGKVLNCTESSVREPEEARGFVRNVTLPESGDYEATLTATPTAGPDLDELIQRNQPLQATGSSVGVPDPRAAGIAAIDGDESTTWTPRLDDVRPVLSLNWIGQRKITGLDLEVTDGAPVRRPRELLLRWPGGQKQIEVPRSGEVKFDPVRTDQMTVQITEADRSRALTSAGQFADLPVGISELKISGLAYDPITVSTDQQALKCGTGPTLAVDGLPQKTRAMVSAEDLYRGRSVEVEPCGANSSLGEVRLDEGTSQISVQGSDLFTPDRLVLDSGDDLGGEFSGAGAQGLGSTRVTLEPAEDASVVVLRQNVNPGWTITKDGQRVPGITVDGWQQGWRVQADGSELEATFAPDNTYRTGLLGGLVCVVGLLGLVLFWRRWGRDDQPALDGRQVGTVPWLAIVLASAGLIGGSVGLLGGVLGVGMGVVVARWSHPGARWALVTLLVLPALAYYVRPWGDFDGWAGDLAWPGHVVIVVLSGVAAVAGDLRRPSFKRIAGSSTSR